VNAQPCCRLQAARRANPTQQSIGCVRLPPACRSTGAPTSFSIRTRLTQQRPHPHLSSLPHPPPRTHHRNLSSLPPEIIAVAPSSIFRPASHPLCLRAPPRSTGLVHARGWESDTVHPREWCSQPPFDFGSSDGSPNGCVNSDSECPF
jgi:hypothetical protein